MKNFLVTVFLGHKLIYEVQAASEAAAKEQVANNRGHLLVSERGTAAMTAAEVIDVTEAS